MKDGLVRPWLPLAAVTAALVAAAGASAARGGTPEPPRYLSVKPLVFRGGFGHVVGEVGSPGRCTITVDSASGPVHARGLHPERPSDGRVAWTWHVPLATAPGRQSVRVICGRSISFRASFRVLR